MRALVLALPTVFALTSSFQSPPDESVGSAIGKLGSARFQDRQAATDWLLQHPSAAPALREALKSTDPEVSKRAEAILGFYDQRQVRDLKAAVEEGAVDKMIDLLAVWPAGKHEQEAWREVCELNRKLVELHEKNGGAKFPWLADPLEPPIVSVAERVTQAFAETSKTRFVRASEVIWKASSSETDAVIISSGSVNVLTPTMSGAIIARGPVRIKNKPGLILVTCSDVHFDCLVAHSIVIARGKITVSKGIVNSRIISGKSVVYDKRYTQNSIITENESNPLGFIRWADAPKDKPGPKKK